jgi:hypothetical protein
MTNTREYLTPTDIVAMLSIVVLGALYAVTREPELKTALLALVVFQTGRLSKRNGKL